MTDEGINEDAMLARLLALNLERAKGQTKIQPTLMADEDDADAD